MSRQIMGRDSKDVNILKDSEEEEYSEKVKDNNSSGDEGIPISKLDKK